MRLLGRPVGLSGSGPTLWTLYPSEDAAGQARDEVRAAANDGRFPSSESPPFIHAATLALTHRHEAEGDKTHDP